MNYKEIITQHKAELNYLANEIKEEINIFYEKNCDSEDYENTYRKFRDIFTTKINDFNLKYGMTCPKVLVDSPYRIYCIKDSIEVYLDLSDYYNLKSNMILDKIPPLDESF